MVNKFIIFLSVFSFSGIFNASVDAGKKKYSKEEAVEGQSKSSRSKKLMQKDIKKLKAPSRNIKKTRLFPYNLRQTSIIPLPVRDLDSEAASNPNTAENLIKAGKTKGLRRPW